MGKMTVYHGSYTIVENPEIIKGKTLKISDLDFTVQLSENRQNAGQNGMTMDL